MSKIVVLSAVGLLAYLAVTVGFVAPVDGPSPRVTHPVSSASLAATGEPDAEVRSSNFAGAVYGIAAVAAAGLLARSKRAPTKRASRVACAAGSVSVSEVKEAQAGWANAIRTISKTYLDGGDYVATAAAAAGELYGYGHGNVLFKPTKAKDVQFRPEAAQAMSYFVGADASGPGGIAEDHGFAINGGKGWSDVLFDNHQIDIHGDVAIAMGNYYFTSASDGNISKVEYTFGYKKCQDGKVRICLHHSSIPYAGAVKNPMAVSLEEVKNAQRGWVEAIKSISKVYLEGGDYVALALKYAGELYGYGHGNVLFKPTKAKDVQFRPEAIQALSYFVGADALAGGEGVSEDHGFAINGGKGWSDVMFDNHQIDLNGNIAIAMGNYYFSSSADGSISKVEYTFGYRKCEDGKVRICLHHSSIPYAGSAPAPGGETKVSTMTSAGPVTTPVAAAFVGSSAPQAAPGQELRHAPGFAYAVQKDSYAGLTFGNDVGYLPDGTPMNKAGNCINHPETIGPDPHAPGTPLPRALFVNDIGYLPDGTPMNRAGNAINHPESIGPDPHAPGSPLPPSAYAADVGYLVDGTPLDSAGNNAIH